MRPMLAILADSVRQLRAKRLFWFVLAISLLIVLAYGSIGFNDKGPTLFYGLKQIDQPMLSRDSMLARVLLEGIFSAFIVNFWLAWGAMILAIVSTCGIFPDFLEDGSIDLVLSKPISRASIFITKYLGSLSFVLLQVFIFCIGVFLVIGWRLDEWRWKVFLAVPMITLMFSYLYAITVVVNVWTKSTLASLLVTMIAWFLIFGAHLSDGILQTLRINAEVAMEMHEERLDSARRDLEEARTNGQPTIEAQARRRIANHEREIEETGDIMDMMGGYIGPVHAFARVLPKTGQTVDLIQRWLEADSELGIMDLLSGDFGRAEDEGRGVQAGFFGDRAIQIETGRRIQEYEDARSAWFIIGSSLAFEVALIAFACLLFTRQDF